MSSSSTLKNPNRLTAERGDLLWAFSDPKALVVLHYIHTRGQSRVAEISGDLGMGESEVEALVARLAKAGLLDQVSGALALSPSARMRVSHGTVSYRGLEGRTIVGNEEGVPHALPNSYRIKACIGYGATSFTFRAEQISTHIDRTLKIFLPDIVTHEQVDAALAKRAQVPRNVAIPVVVDSGQVRVCADSGESYVVPCVALEYVDDGARTLHKFLEAQENITGEILERFIERVGGALEAIEAAGLFHGDLHDGNILVLPGSSRETLQDFRVIDFLGVPSRVSPELEIPSDLESFRNHLLRAVVTACERYPGYAARYLLGEPVSRVLRGLREGVYSDFAQMMDDFRRSGTEIPENHFRKRAPQPFEWLRVEWIDSPEWLYRLFEPVLSRYETISRFGNTWISGPRGSGKSHYLRILAFHPKVIAQARGNQELENKLAELHYDFRKAFGVLFTCRLGEFKAFTPEAMGADEFDLPTQSILRHIIVLKIWNRTLETIRQGLETTLPRESGTVLRPPNQQEIQRLVHFLEERLGKMAAIGSCTPTTVFRQCLAMCTARENSAVARWHEPSQRPQDRMLDEQDLDAFFGTLREVFSDLCNARFFVLVDDASFGHMCFEMQKVLNSLVRATQANHCFKITCDKFMYTLDTTDARAIDPRHEVTYVDLGEISTRAQRDQAVDHSEYMARVVDRRLKAFNYASDIRHLLGNSQKPKEFLSALSQPGSRRPQRQGVHPRRERPARAIYAGWNIEWHLSHGSVRTLLELIEDIFLENDVKQQTTTTLSLASQDRAVRRFCTRQFKALSMLPGAIKGAPLGTRLQAVVSAIGEISQQYLRRYDTGAPGRWYETISVERLDLGVLSENAQTILTELVKWGLLLDEGTTFSRAQFGLCKRYDMNKIFAPAFQTTYRVRNHLYLSADQFDMFLTTPDRFVRKHRRKLDDLAHPRRRVTQRELFGESDE